MINVVGVLLGALLLAGGYALAGDLGAITVAAAITVWVLLALRLGLPTPVTVERSAPKQRRTAEAEVSDFPAYARIRAALTRAGESQWAYDRHLRPVLVDALRVVLADPHRLDLERDLQEARGLVGEELWPLVDPTAPPAQERDSHGPTRPEVAEIVERLEQL